MVQFAGPQNPRSCPERGGTREGAEPLPEQPGVQRCRKCETSPPPYPGARPGLLGPNPGRRLWRVAALIPAPRCHPELGGRAPGGNRDLAEQEDWVGHYDPLFLKGSWAQVSRACRTQDTSHDPGCGPGQARCPRPQPVLSLGTPAALLRSSIAPDPLPQPRQPRACLVSALPCFLYPCTFCTAKWVKGPNQKAVSKKFLSDMVLHPEHQDH